MLVGHVRVRMPHRLVAVQVAVRSSGHRIVTVGVVPVVVAVGMLVLEPFVLVLVSMALRQVQDDARGHQHGGDQHPGTAAALAERHSQQRTDEGGECKHRASARRTERPLGQQVQAQAQTIPGGAHNQ